MAAGANTLFQLKSDANGVFDGSAKGIAVIRAANTKQVHEGLKFDNSVVELSRNSDLDNLQSFTIQATITPEVLRGERQNILEAESPAISLFIDPSGKLVGSVNTATGWVGVDSGSTLLGENTTVKIAFARDEGGKTELEIDGRVVGSNQIPGPIINVGTQGFKIGTWVDGRSWPFVGRIEEIEIKKGIVDRHLEAKKLQAEQTIEQSFKLKTGLSRIIVNLHSDASYSRLQPIKDIMNAAGVQKLSDLETLRITTRTLVSPGKVLVAAKKGSSINWTDVAKNFKLADGNAKREILAKYLVNRNSAPVLKRMQPPNADDTTDRASPTPGTVLPLSRMLLRGGRIAGLGDSTRTSPRLSKEVLMESPTIRRDMKPTPISETIMVEDSTIKLADPALLKNIEENNPTKWPITGGYKIQIQSLHTIPVASAVIIASTLDLTNIELVIEPDVRTLYIIAEQVICGPNASITWRRPGGSTPPRADNSDLNGRGWSGVHTKNNSRDGLDGEDGRSGEPGISGAPGKDAPSLEMWVKDMSAIPNIDLNGEEGIKGGRGQRGGRGGDGADGRVGERIWFFGWHCTTDPGDGGDGGNGGMGGSGGRGGNAGNGGKITIGVLEETLESTVTSRAFKIKNQGGQRGRGEEGGPGGAGGRGGRSGVGETCQDAENGHDGATGQPGPMGQDGSIPGIDGEIAFFEFTQSAWDELLTRPWLSEVSPSEAFPGDSLTLRGSRFSSSDWVMVGTKQLTPTINADESISVNIPIDMSGGETVTYLRRTDGTESNRRTIWIKPQLDPITDLLNPGTIVTLNGKAFLAGASVLVNGASNPANFFSPTRISFTMPGTGGTGSSGGSVIVQVRNPDGLVSNGRTASIPRILEIPFRFGVHNLMFPNFDDGVPDWSTYEDTFGAAEVWHELLDPIFGHPVLTAAFYVFYHYFLKGESNGGLATGFCTSLASLVADNFWQGRTDTPTITKVSVQKMLTAVHGKLLSRESLLHFHDQGREGIARVEKTYREIEATFLRGVDRNNAPLLFFIPSGEVWDEGYIDKLGKSHCVMPYRFVYPTGHSGPALSPDSSTTTTDLDKVEMYVWDCNHPESTNCKLVFSRVGGRIEYEYFDDSTTPQFRSQDNITLGMMTNGQYMLSDHDLPFTGPFGLTRFVIDFLLSPADLQITDANGLRTGNFGGQVHSEIPDSHPCYLVKGAYMLPEDTALTRRIVGLGTGTYDYNSIMPDGTTVTISGVSTDIGQEDILSISSDATQIRFTSAVEKTFSITLARKVGDQMRAIALAGAGGGPGEDIDITVSPEMSVLRMGNRGTARNVNVKAFAIAETTNTPVNRQMTGINLPANHDLAVTVTDWAAVDIQVEALAFE